MQTFREWLFIKETAQGAGHITPDAGANGNDPRYAQQGVKSKFVASDVSSEKSSFDPDCIFKGCKKKN